MRVKIFARQSSNRLEQEINEWLSTLKFKIEKVEYGVAEGVYSACIWYRV